MVTTAHIVKTFMTVSSDSIWEKKIVGKLKEQCIAKPEPYAERKRRREAEIEGRFQRRLAERAARRGFHGVI